MIHFNKMQQLEMWYRLYKHLKSIPHPYHSETHYNYINKVKANIYVLATELNLKYFIEKIKTETA